MDEGLAVIIAAILAIAGIFYTSRQQRKMLRKQHTFQVIEKLSGWTELDACNTHAAKLAKCGKMPVLGKRFDRKDCEKLDFLLNYYEMLASAIVCGDIDEDLMRRMERGRLVRCYLYFLPYVEENRKEMNSIGVWENLEFVAYRWTVSNADLTDNLIDRFFLRPSMVQFAYMRQDVSSALWQERSKMIVAP